MKKGILTALLVIIILLAVLVIIGGLFYLQVNQRPSIPTASYLQIHLKGRISDTDSSLFSPRRLTIRELFYQIHRARKDERIRGLILKISPLYNGIDVAEEIGQLAAEFKKSGKKVFAFIENGGLKELLCASYADRVYALRDNFISIPGISIQAVFLKNTLEKIGIEPQFFQIAEYKTGPNMFTEEGFTRAHRESYQALLDDIYASSLRTLSENRPVSRETLTTLFGEFPTSNAVYLEHNLIDGIAYEDEILSREDISLPVTRLETYRMAGGPKPFTGEQKIAIIFAGGEIHEGASGSSSLTGNQIMGSDTISGYLRKCRKDDGIRAVIFRVNSPGGSPVASDIIRREAELVNNEKPLVVSMSEVAGSGGYYISLSSSRILAFPQTITGSIGVYGGKFVLKDFYDRIGLRKEMLSTGPYAGMFTDYRPFTRAESVKYRRIMEGIYQSFVARVLNFRPIAPEEIDRIARGRVWAGESAIRRKLIDEFGGLSRALEVARELAGIDPSDPVSLIVYPPRMTLAEFLIKSVIEYNTQDDLGISRLPGPRQLGEDLKRYRHFFPAYLLPCRPEIR